MKYNKEAEILHNELLQRDFEELTFIEKMKLNALENLICELRCEEDMLTEEGLEIYFDFEVKEVELFEMNYNCTFFKDSAIIDNVLYSRKAATKLLTTEIDKY